MTQPPVQYHVTVDPGLNGTGWALWVEERSSYWSLRDSGALIPRGTTLELRLLSLQDKLEYTLDGAMEEGSLIPKVATWSVEHPQHFASAGATNASGALVTLAMAAGIALVTGEKFQPTKSQLVSLQWKGQLPKAVCCARIVERLKRDPRMQCWAPNTKTTHEIDAIGIGLHLQGRF